MNTEVEMEVHGERRAHNVRLSVAVKLAKAATPMTISRSGGLVDPGDPPEPGSVEIESGFVQRARSSGYVMEKALPASVLAKMRSDSKLESWLYSRILEGFPDA